MPETFKSYAEIKRTYEMGNLRDDLLATEGKDCMPDDLTLTYDRWTQETMQEMSLLDLMEQYASIHADWYEKFVHAKSKNGVFKSNKLAFYLESAERDMNLIKAHLVSRINDLDVETRRLYVESEPTDKRLIALNAVTKSLYGTEYVEELKTQNTEPETNDFYGDLGSDNQSQVGPDARPEEQADLVLHFSISVHGLNGGTPQLHMRG
jgi:hypothetical protein